MTNKAKLLLEDGSVFHGTPIGTEENVQSEVVFTTGMTGFQETITDPSFCNQIVSFTYPLVGNCGVNIRDFESMRPYLSGVVTKELCETPSHWQEKISFNEYLKNSKITGIAGVDTRKLSKIIRAKGTMKGKIICHDDLPVINPDKTTDCGSPISLVEIVTTKEPYVIPGGDTRLVVLDFGVKQSLLNSLSELGATLIVLPAFTSAEEIKSYRPHGVVLSNGPGDPKDISEVIPTIEKLLLDRVPLFGICLGHQLLGLTLGYDSFKMRFGHRGGNHPVKDLTTGKATISSQNHGYALENTPNLSGVSVTHVNLNDNTVEGLAHEQLPAFSVQFHPEASPGPGDSRNILSRYLQVVKSHQIKEGESHA